MRQSPFKFAFRADPTDPFVTEPAAGCCKPDRFTFRESSNGHFVVESDPGVGVTPVESPTIVRSTVPPLFLPGKPSFLGHSDPVLLLIHTAVSNFTRERSSSSTLSAYRPVSPTRPLVSLCPAATRTPVLPFITSAVFRLRSPREKLSFDKRLIGLFAGPGKHDRD